MPYFRIGKFYSFTVSRLHPSGWYFVLRYKGKETTPFWAKKGLYYCVPILDGQDVEKCINRKIKCKVINSSATGFPILEQIQPKINRKNNKKAHSQSDALISGEKVDYTYITITAEENINHTNGKKVVNLENNEHFISEKFDRECIELAEVFDETKEKFEEIEEQDVTEHPKEEQKFNMLLQDAAAGNVEAQYEVSLCYRDGIGVTQDYEKAVEWCTASAKGGFIRAAYALYKLGEIHEEGKAAPFDMQRALYYYQISAEQNLLVAQLKLAELYEQGWSGDTDTTQPLHWYQCAALNGHVESCFKLGVYHFAAISAENNEPLAFKWFKTAADAGHKEAAFHVALSYLSGRGVEQSGDKAVAYLEKSIDADIDEALYLLGLCYSDGYFTPKNEQKAFDLFKRAAMRGHVASAYRVASCYEYARGVSQDYQQAYEWYTKAAEEGEYQAITTLSSPQWVIRKMSI